MRLAIKAILAMINICECQLDDIYRSTKDRNLEIELAIKGTKEARRQLVIYLDK